jgi:predicted RNase H-like HicB family nuclease
MNGTDAYRASVEECPSGSFCADCPDREACASGYPSSLVRHLAREFGSAPMPASGDVPPPHEDECPWTDGDPLACTCPPLADGTPSQRGDSSVRFVADGGYWLAEDPSRPGCHHIGPSQEAALAGLADAREHYDAVSQSRESSEVRDA